MKCTDRNHVPQEISQEDATPLLEEIINSTNSYSDGPVENITDVVVGTIKGIDSEGNILVDYPFNPTGEPVAAKAMRILDEGHTGRDVALMFEGGDHRKPIIAGLMHTPGHAHDTCTEQKNIVISAKEELSLVCGKAFIHLKKDGSIIINGTTIVSRASGNHDIKGGMINLN